MRSLVRRPAFALAAAGTLALGIAASTALFSTVNAALLTPLPYPRAGDLYSVHTFFPNGRFTIGLVATEELAELQKASSGIAAAATTQRFDVTIASGADARPIVAYGVSPQFFDLFGVPPLLGRGIVEADDVRGAPTVVVLSHALWTSAFGANAAIVGTSIGLKDVPARVVGVAPASFDVPAGADAWINQYWQPTIGHAFDGYVRLKAGVTPAALEQPMKATMDALGKKYPDQDKDRAFRLTPLLEATVGDLGGVLVILFGATGLLLALAAANVTNLMLTRSAGRAREFAVRAALGASRGRLVAHLVGESLTLSLAGGALGLAIAYAGVRILVRLGGSRLPRLNGLTFDWHVVVFVMLLVVVTGLIIGLVPGLRLAGTDVASLMNGGGRSVHGSRAIRRILASFVVAELAVTLALVAGASGLVQSYWRLAHADPGFDPQGRLVLDAVLPIPYTGSAQMSAWLQSADAALRRAGATRVAAASSLPLAHEWDSTTFVDIVSRPDIPPDQRPNARIRMITPGFFEAMGIRLVAGRPFTAQDSRDSTPVVIVNQAFVRRFLGDRDPLREVVKDLHHRIVGQQVMDDPVTVVGVAADVQYAALTIAPEPVVYVPKVQYGGLARMSVVVTTTDGHPERRASEFAAALRAVEPRAAVDAGTMQGRIAASLERQRLGMWLMTAFGVAALVLATVGVFGVLAYVVSQRTSEMAIRQALGASRERVFWIIAAEGARTAAAGIAGGLLLAWWTGAVIGRYVYGVRPGDLAVLLGSAAAVAVATMAATAAPALRAALFEPARALHQD